MSFATADERYFVSLVNASRAEKGLPALKIEKRLNDAADAHSKWMLDADVFSHTGRNKSEANHRIEAAGFDLSGEWQTSENIAYVSVQGNNGLRDEVRQLHKMLMDSPGHKANLMRDIDYVGIGLQVGNFRRDGQDYKVVMVTQNFADTEGQVRIDNGGFQKVKLAAIATAMPSKSDWNESFDGQLFRKAVSGTSRADEYRLGSGHDRVAAGSGNDWVAGGAGNDTLRGGNGSDRLIGDSGRDRLDGDGGNDTLHGGNDHDYLTGGSGDDLLWGDSGNDTLVGGTGNDRLIGKLGDDAIYGQDGRDRISGDAGKDILSGGAGKDTLDGGAGNDRLSGGTGIDTFVFRKGGDMDRITDYEQGIDKILISSSLLSGSPASFIQDHMTKTSAGVVIDFGGGDRLIVAGDGVTVTRVADDLFAF